MLSSSAVTACYSLPRRTKQWTCNRQGRLSFSVDINIFHESRTTAISNENGTFFDEFKIMISYYL